MAFAFSSESLFKAFVWDLGNNLKDSFFSLTALSMSSVDLEQICLSRLELAEIASQRHHALTSGNIVYACMRALEDAAILNELDLEKR